jgi:DNA-binding MarR family transcriptional regulator
MSNRQSVSDQDKGQLKALLTALEPFRELKSTMPLQYVATFLLVATDEGKSVTEYANKAGLTQSVMTRHLLDMGEFNRYREEGFNLIEQVIDPMDRRSHLARLTVKGRGLVARLGRALERA